MEYLGKTGFVVNETTNVHGFDPVRAATISRLIDQKIRK